jgi:hypothetical protein
MDAVGSLRGGGKPAEFAGNAGVAAPWQREDSGT